MESIDELLNANCEQLSKWFQRELGDKFDDFKYNFIKQRIDGRNVALLTEAHLAEMSPDSAIGDRLHVMAMRDKIVRAARMARRNHVVLEGKAEVHPPGQEASIVLTTGALKLLFETTQKVRGPGGPDATRVVNTTYTDHIDIVTITDVDIQSDTQTTKTYKMETKTIEIPAKGCFGKKTFEEEHVRVMTGERTHGVAKLYIRLSVPTTLGIADQGRDEEGTNGLNEGVHHLSLTVEPYEDGEKLQNELILLMDEARQVQIVHHE